MVSHPTFDPNEFAHHIDRADWQRLTSDPSKPLMNKAIQARLAPGSVFKIVTGTAALETGTSSRISPSAAPERSPFYGHTYHDWRSHGIVDFHRAWSFPVTDISTPSGSSWVLTSSTTSRPSLAWCPHRH